MDGSLFDGLDMSVEHRGIRRQAGPMRGLRSFKPFSCRFLTLKEQVVDTVGEDFRTAARETRQTMGFELEQHFGHWFAGNALDVDELDHCECLDVGIRADGMHGVQQVEVVLVGQLFIDAGDHVDFGHWEVFCALKLCPDIIHRHPVRVWPALLRVKRAELAALVADIRVVDVLIAHIERIVAVLGLTDKVCQSADIGEAWMLPQADAIIKAQALTFHHFCVNVRNRGCGQLAVQQGWAHGFSS